MFFYLKISCKNKKNLKKFLKFFKRLKLLPILVKPFSRHQKFEFVSVLKSPHVNKTAQEQFEYRYFFKDFLIFSFKPLIFILFLKKLKSFTFLSIKFEIQVLSENKKVEKHLLRLINPDNLILQKISFQQNYLDFYCCKKYIQLFDSYGEIYLQNVFLESKHL